MKQVKLLPEVFKTWVDKNTEEFTKALAGVDLKLSLSFTSLFHVYGEDKYRYEYVLEWLKTFTVKDDETEDSMYEYLNQIIKNLEAKIEHYSPRMGSPLQIVVDATQFKAHKTLLKDIKDIRDNSEFHLMLEAQK